MYIVHALKQRKELTQRPALTNDEESFHADCCCCRKDEQNFNHFVEGFDKINMHHHADGIENVEDGIEKGAPDGVPNRTTVQIPGADDFPDKNVVAHRPHGHLFYHFCVYVRVIALLLPDVL